MAHVRLYDGSSESGDGDSNGASVRRVHDMLRRRLGFVPETYQAMGRSGRFLAAVVELDRSAGANLDERVRQLLAVAVSAANGCGYCLHAHRALAIGAGCTEEEVTGAIEVAAMMSAYNTFNKSIGLRHDVTLESVRAPGAERGPGRGAGPS